MDPLKELPAPAGRPFPPGIPWSVSLQLSVVSPGGPVGRWGGPTVPGPGSCECADRAQAGSCPLPLREATAQALPLGPHFRSRN